MPSYDLTPEEHLILLQATSALGETQLRLQSAQTKFAQAQNEMLQAAGAVGALQSLLERQLKAVITVRGLQAIHEDGSEWSVDLGAKKISLTKPEGE